MFFRKLFYTIMYLRHPRWDTGISPPELMDFIRANPPGNALDLGCGTGTNAITLAQHGWKVTGVDFVARPIQLARYKARQANLSIDFIQGDVTNLRGISGKFELILDIGCFHSLTDEGRQAYLANLGRFLAPGGTFLLYGLLKSQEGQSRRGLNEKDFTDLLKHLSLDWRRDSTDRERPSTWLCLNKPVDA